MTDTKETTDFLRWIKTECGEELANELAVLSADPEVKEIDPVPDIKPEDPVQEEKKSSDIRKLLEDMGISEKIKTAMFGNSVCRRLLIFNPNKMIQECVLNNPKLQLNEIEDYVKNSNMDSQVLRSIASRSYWMRSYKVKLGLVSNPKTPPDLSMKWLKFLNLSDVKQLSRSRNIPQVIQLAAKKRVSEEEAKK